MNDRILPPFPNHPLPKENHAFKFKSNNLELHNRIPIPDIDTSNFSNSKCISHQAKNVPNRCLLYAQNGTKCCRIKLEWFIIPSLRKMMSWIFKWSKLRKQKTQVTGTPALHFLTLMLVFLATLPSGILFKHIKSMLCSYRIGLFFVYIWIYFKSKIHSRKNISLWYWDMWEQWELKLQTS